jgi:hypothetical protein
VAGGDAEHLPDSIAKAFNTTAPALYTPAKGISLPFSPMDSFGRKRDRESPGGRVGLSRDLTVNFRHLSVTDNYGCDRLRVAW